jgi:predicted metal-dependent phosphotriesterase family hydrolase
MRVETVRGVMAVDGLSTTLMHEHVFVLTRARSWTGRS